MKVTLNTVKTLVSRTRKINREQVCTITPPGAVGVCSQEDESSRSTSRRTEKDFCRKVERGEGGAPKEVEAPETCVGRTLTSVGEREARNELNKDERDIQSRV